MKKTFFIACICSAAFLLGSPIYAQESLSPLHSNSILAQYRLTHPLSRLSSVSPAYIDLPFVDDFSSANIYPDTANWLDNLVFVNNNFARNMISVGVATFDGLDANGNAYVNNNPLATGSCDTLTSHPVYLLTRPSSAGGGQYSAADSIRLSFYYEKKGWGDTPDPADSLLLEFFNPSNNIWSQAWFTTGGLSAGQDTIFFPVNIRITDTAYFKDGFQFRFRNIGSRTGALDQWHLDYVRLYKALNALGQMDTVLKDVAMTLPGQSLLKTYTSVPWNDFKTLSPSDQQLLLRDSLVMYYRNNNNTTQDIGFNNRIYNFNGTYVEGFGADNGNIFAGIQPGTTYRYAFALDSILPYSPSLLPDTNEFTVLNYFSNGNSLDGLKSNDTTTYLQGFYNYYSYDDGTAEAGYDLVSSPNGKLAMQFDLIKPDTIRAVRMFFVQQNQSVTNLLFTIKIWSSLNPETLIYQDLNNRPVYTGSINGFSTYVLDQTVPVSGTVYIGFQQISPDGLHLGYDRNTANNLKMFYNLTGTWSNVNVAPGSFMIRPVMGDSTLFTGVKGVDLTAAKFRVYPVPASGKVHISTNEIVQDASLVIRSFDGKLCRQLAFQDEFSVDDLAPGLYLLILQLKDGSQSIQRFIVQH